MAFRITPSLGPDVEQIGPTTGFYWDLNNVSAAGVQRVSYQLGSEVNGSDGFSYILVVAGANVALDTAVTFTSPTFVATAGGAAWKTPLLSAVTTGQFFHARSAAI